jgi:F0F1-type ATP synthase assembly protein I
VSSGDDRQQITYGLALASVVSQIGCVTIVVVIGALVVGLGLDRVFDSRPLFTILFVLGSIPVSLFLLVRIALSTAAQLAPPSPKASEDASPDKDKLSQEE